ncbi:hypothetical protein CC78DRAFT_530035 [Lojkania enalia]|uniref:Uncharacterized protein n=1 Tax=Lojkania enalia TaxID=147567 RepID=A0A9P4KJP0_9PLEO|nr:hypothetical protein CC78DRAFT_530035 [Didymosphaeria enalia]
MAGLQPTPSPNDITSATAERVLSPTRLLPNGSCTFRDLAGGSTCGCNQFWDKCSAELHAGSTEKRPSSERSTWCVCSHHACFHQLHASIAPAESRVQPKCDGHCQRQPGSSCDIHRAAAHVDEEVPPFEGSHGIGNGHLKILQAVPSHELLRQGTPQVNGTSQTEGPRDTTSQPSASGLPRVPSVCFLSHDRQPAAENESRQVRSDARQARHDLAGLGLSLINSQFVRSPTNRPQSVSSTVPDEVILPNGSYSESELLSTNTNSVRDEHEKGNNAPLDQVLEFNRHLHIDVGGDTIPNTYNPDEFMQSATEVATPSNVNTPNLGVADQAVQDTKRLIEALVKLTSSAEHRSGSETRPTSATSARIPQLLLTNSPTLPQEHLQQALRSASPQTFQKLVSYLNPLHNLLNSIPNVATTIREINNRLDLLENQSFNHVHPEDVQQQFEMYDGRILEIEHWKDEHDRLHQAIDADYSSNSFCRRGVATTNDSFGSNHSVQSTTSSALIVAAMDRKEIDTEFESIKDRLSQLESVSMPTAINPWEVEIVLLPWGRELRGIWFSQDEPMHNTRPTTQDSEEWTQVRTLRIAAQNSHPASPKLPELSVAHAQLQLFSKGPMPSSDAESGWSSQAISDWVTRLEDDLLSPKACGSNNLVYKRLQSRGFVKNVTLKSASARDIQATLSAVFGDVLECLHTTNADEHPFVSSFPGLRASFIPLRKAVKESRLRFLTPAEMASSAIWSAQFLAAGVMMRVSGGNRRLYVTHREAYLQPIEEEESCLTWQRLRQLPRFQEAQDSQTDGNEGHCQPQVAEADAREACWAFFEAYDQPPVSVTSSFSSNHSIQLSVRPAERQWRRSITPSSILKNKQPHPISPLSENHPRRPSYSHDRTASTSAIEQLPQGTSKRRLNSSPVKQSSAPHAYSRRVSVSMSHPKRRRVGNSSPNEDEQQDWANTWKNAPYPSREPPSPFYSSHPELLRTNSDLASRPSQRSIAVVGKATPFAYATPHSGPVTGIFKDQAGDTEPDDNYEDDNDDDEQSWRGVDEEGESGDDSDAQGGAEMDIGSSSDDSGFGSEREGDDDDEGYQGNNDYLFGAQRQRQDDDDNEEGDVFDTLLGVLRN